MTGSEAQHDNATLTERALDLVQRDILSGALKPGARLGVAELSSTYGIGTTPIREALSRLTSKNLISATNGRGFRVSELSRADLQDITLTRLVLEAEGLRLSMLHGDDEWEAGIVADIHRLRLYVERNSTENGMSGAGFDQLHRQFHASLIAGCGSRRIMNLSKELYDQAYRYRTITMRQQIDGEEFVQTHVIMADAVRSRDVDRAVKLLHHHLNRTLHSIYPGD